MIAVQRQHKTIMFNNIMVSYCMTTRTPCCIIYDSACSQTKRTFPPPPIPRFQSLWWRQCTGASCPALVCGSQMRRKAEVLKHKRSASGLTKKKIYSDAMRNGRIVRIPNSSGGFQYAEQKKHLTCKPKSTSPLPAYYSNVPGTANLVYDPSIQLMNYRPPLRNMPTSTMRTVPLLISVTPSSED